MEKSLSLLVGEDEDTTVDIVRPEDLSREEILNILKQALSQKKLTMLYRVRGIYSDGVLEKNPFEDEDRARRAMFEKVAKQERIEIGEWKINEDSVASAEVISRKDLIQLEVPIDKRIQKRLLNAGTFSLDELFTHAASETEESEFEREITQKLLHQYQTELLENPDLQRELFVRVALQKLNAWVQLSNEKDPQAEKEGELLKEQFEFYTFPLTQRKRKKPDTKNDFSDIVGHDAIKMAAKLQLLLQWVKGSGGKKMVSFPDLATFYDLQEDSLWVAPRQEMSPVTY